MTARDIFRDIIERAARAKEEAAKDRKERDERSRTSREFREAWNSVYPHRTNFESDEFVRDSLRNVINLRQTLTDRCWDFHLAEFVGTPDRNEHWILAAVILIHASVGDEKAIERCLIDGRPLMPGIMDAHQELLDWLEDKSKHGLPFTPPITRIELAKLANLTYHQLSRQIKDHQWKTLDDVRHQRLKRWRHTDNIEIQQDVLDRCRKIFPQKLWPD